MDSSINWVRTNTPPPAVWLSPIPKMTQGPGPNDNDRLPWGPRSGSGEVVLNRLITPWAVPGVVHQQAAPDLRRPRSSVVNRTDQGQCQRHHHAPAQQWPRSACRGSCGLEYRILGLICRFTGARVDHVARWYSLMSPSWIGLRRTWWPARLITCGVGSWLDRPRSALDEQLLDVAIGHVVPQVPAHCQHDHLPREPKARKR